MIYFDNAATTFPKPTAVLASVKECLKKYCGNPGRSSHKLSVRSSEEIYAARETVADFFGIDTPENVVFTHNATDALNIAIKTTVENECHIITSDIEHNAVIRPIHKLIRTRNIEHSCFDSDKSVFEQIKEQAKKKTSCIVSTVASNVTGKQIDIKELSRAREKLKIPLIIDASQAAGHKAIKANETPFDILCAPAHKSLFGIQGCGFIIFNDERARESFIEGGSGYESRNRDMPTRLPERFEAGTMAVPSIVALRHGIEFIIKTGIDKISEHLDSMSERAVEILSAFKNVRISAEGGGIVSFNIGAIPSSVISSELDKRGICTRSGLHCAPDAHKKLQTLETGTVRLSFSFFNCLSELEIFYKELKYMYKTVF